MGTISIKDIDVLIICGGLGTRLKNLFKDRPKPMAEINNKPFLDMLIEYITDFGFRRFILCAGHKAEVIEEYYRNRNSGVDILISTEEAPLGTGGAIKNAQRFIKSDIFLAMNGDSFCDVDLYKFIDFHMNKKGLISIALVRNKDNADYGSVIIDDSGRIISFEEKGKKDNANMINAGIYLFNAQALSLMPTGKNFSLEYDFFPNNIDRGLYGYITEGLFIDIGTPGRYQKAKRFLKDRYL